MSTTKNHNLIPQKDSLGCGVSCLSILTGLPYDKVINVLNKNNIKIENGLYLKELVFIAGKITRLDFFFKHIKTGTSLKYMNGMIVYLKKTKMYPYGHYLIRDKDVWHDSWINFPLYPAAAGTRIRLPYKPSYYMFYENSK